MTDTNEKWLARVAEIASAFLKVRATDPNSVNRISAFAQTLSRDAIAAGYEEMAHVSGNLHETLIVLSSSDAAYGEQFIRTLRETVEHIASLAQAIGTSVGLQNGASKVSDLNWIFSTASLEALIREAAEESVQILIKEEHEREAKEAEKMLHENYNPASMFSFVSTSELLEFGPAILAWQEKAREQQSGSDEPKEFSIENLVSAFLGNPLDQEDPTNTDEAPAKEVANSPVDSSPAPPLEEVAVAPEAVEEGIAPEAIAPPPAPPLEEVAAAPEAVEEGIAPEAIAPPPAPPLEEVAVAPEAVEEGIAPEAIAPPPAPPLEEVAVAPEAVEEGIAPEAIAPSPAPPLEEVAVAPEAVEEGIAPEAIAPPPAPPLEEVAAAPEAVEEGIAPEAIAPPPAPPLEEVAAAPEAVEEGIAPEAIAPPPAPPLEEVAAAPEAVEEGIAPEAIAPPPAPPLEEVAVAPEAVEEDDLTPVPLQGDPGLMADFLTEASEHLEGGNAALLGLEKNPDDEEKINELFRAFHSLKGVAGFLGLSQMGKVGHVSESLFDMVRTKEIELTPEVLDVAFEAVDMLEKLRLHIADALAKGGLLVQEPSAAAFVNRVERAMKGDFSRDDTPPTPLKKAVVPTASLEEAPSPIFEEDDLTPVPLQGDPGLMADFLTEASEHLEGGNAALLGLEKNPDDEEKINELFRAFHSLKGVAGFLGLSQMGKVGHVSESLFDMVRTKEIELTPEVLDVAFEAVDMLEKLRLHIADALAKGGLLVQEPSAAAFVNRVERAMKGDFTKHGQAIPSPQTPQTPQIPDSTQKPRAQTQNTPEKSENTMGHERVRESIRVDQERLQEMIDTIGELVLAENMMVQNDTGIQVDDTDASKKFHTLHNVTRQLQELSTAIRMVPISTLFQRMARLIRDLSRRSQKKVVFESSGGETELDRGYVDKLTDPLTHMIRNSVDHGLEMPEERIKAGKNPAGTITLRAYHQGGSVHIEIIDDGAGIDAQRVREKAIARQLISEKDVLSEQDILNLIFMPGFSTREQVTEVSGRGVGMDVVKRNINDMRGQIYTSTTPGKGSFFRIALPLTVALIEGMLVTVGKERFVLPVLSISEVVRPAAEDIHTVAGFGEIIRVREKHIPMYRLNRVFKIPNATEKITDSWTIIAHYAGREIGLMVDDLLGIQQTMIKSLTQSDIDTGGLSGGCILADGHVGLIIDVSSVVSMANSDPTSMRMSPGPSIRIE